MRVHYYYPTILLIVAVLDFHGSESAKFRRKTEGRKVSIVFPSSTSASTNTSVNESASSSFSGNELPKTIVVDLPSDDSPSAKYVYDGIELKYIKPTDKRHADGAVESKSRKGKSVPNSTVTGLARGKTLNSDAEFVFGLIKAAKVLKAVGLVLGGLWFKLLFKFLLTFGSSIPAAAVALPTITSFYFLAGVLFGRLTAVIINPPTTSTPSPVTAVGGAGAVTTTTPAPAPVGSATATLFSGTNLSGNGATLTQSIGVCVDIPPQVDNTAQSLDTMGNCVVLCDTAGCGGTCYRFTGATAINDLGSFNFMASSIMFC